MGRQIIFYGNHFIEFYKPLDEKVKSKIQWVFTLIKQVHQVPSNFLKHLKGTNGLYEIRVEYESNICRIFCCFDKGKIVVLLNGFQKKTQKTPKSELDRAERLMKEYFKSK